MRVMVIIRSTRSSEAGELPGTELLAAMGKYNEELVDAGIMLAGEGLKPSSQGVRILFSGADRTVTDGPFAETKELIAGFWIWKVASMDEAISWAKRCPNPMPEASEIEIRPVYEAEDLGADFTPELREQEAALRARTLGLGAPAFVDGPPLLVAGLAESYGKATRSGIPAQWDRLSARLDAIPGREGDDAYGVCVNADADCNFDYFAGVPVSSADGLPDGVRALRIDPRRYAVFPHTGHVSELPATIDAIWSRWAPECGLDLAHDAPCLERYAPDFDPAAGRGGIEVWIPLAS